jgi:hypothetical protein
MATSLGVDVAWIRFGWVLFAFFTGGAALLVYIVLLFVIPEEPPRVAAVDGDPTRVDPLAAGSDPSGRARPSDERPPATTPGNVPLVLGLVLIAIGVWYLVRQLLPPIDFGSLWPVLAIGLGAVLLVASLRRSA